MEQQQGQPSSQQDKENMAVVERLNKEATVLLDLNDFCLKQIFNNLPMVDLATMVETCKRFVSLAQDEMKLKDEAKVYKIYANDAIRENLPEIERILRNFGVYMNEVRVLFRNDFCQCHFECVEAIFQHLFNYCANTLQCLAIHDLNRPLPQSVRHLFDKVPKLVFENCSRADLIFEEIKVSNCSILEFRNTKVSSIMNLDKCIFPHLTSFVIKHGFSYNDEYDLSQFLQNHQWSIRKLSIWPSSIDTNAIYGYPSRAYDYESINVIRNLEDLELYGSPFNQSVRELVELKQLKRLIICEFDNQLLEPQPCAEFLYHSRSAHKLEYLELRYVDLERNLIAVLSQYKNLRELALMCVPNLNIGLLADLQTFSELQTLRIQQKIEYGVASVDLIKIMSNFPKIQHIHLRSWIKVSITWNTIVNLSSFCHYEKRQLHLCLCGANKQHPNTDLIRLTSDNLFQVTVGSCDNF